MKALVVDDSRAIRSVLTGFLASSGFEVAQAADGREALAYLGEHTDTRVALVDWNMPEMTGLELIEAVRADDRFAGLKLVMVTTETEMAHMQRAFAAGADEYVMKPFTREVIIEKLRLVGMEAD